MKKLGIVLVSMLISAVAFGATFNFFAPANGVLKGSSSTYVTTPAVSSDIAGLWGGTCNSSTYLRGDGTCATPPGTGGGTVNSVALTAPSMFSVSGSPVTNTGTLALTFATGQTANKFLATPDGTTGAVSLRSIVAGDLPAINLISGVTGTLPFGNGGTNATSFTNHGVIVAGASSLGSLAVLGSDTLLQGSTGANPGPVSVPNCGSSTQALAYSTSTHTFSCQTISAGTGTVTSVGLTAPSVFSVSGSPVTSSGTLAVTFATGQTANQVLATPNGTTGAVGLRALVGADIPATNLASGTNGGVTGNLGVSHLNSGTSASSTTFWRGDGTWSTPAYSSGANPSASVGLTAVNGSATTYMRSDAAPALDQSISPTWTGTHLFTGNTPATTGTTGVYVGSVNVGTEANIRWINSSAGVDAKIWDLHTKGANDIALRSLDDASTTSKIAFGVTRSGNVVSNVYFGNSTDNPTYTFAGTGTTTFGGPVAITQSTNGTLGLTVTNSNAGTSTTSRLTISNGTDVNIFGIQGTAFSGTTFAAPAGSGAAYLGTTTSKPLVFGTNGNARFIIGASGEWQIGTGLTSGIAGQVFVSGGSGAAPSWSNNTANPSASAGLTAVNGSATTFMRSDGAPAISQSISPTWTGNHTYSPTSGTGLTVNGSSSSTPALNIASGTLQLGGSAGTSGQVLTSQGSGAAPIWATPGVTTGSFTATLTGMTATTTGTINYSVSGNLVTLTAYSNIQGTSNAITMTMTGLPLAIQPTHDHTMGSVQVWDNSTGGVGNIIISGGTITFGKCGGSPFGCSSATFTSSGTKGISASWTAIYPLD